MTTYLGKRCSFCLPRVPFVNCRQFMYLVVSPFGFEGRIWDLIVSVPDHCLSFYFSHLTVALKIRSRSPTSDQPLILPQRYRDANLVTFQPMVLKITCRLALFGLNLPA